MSMNTVHLCNYGYICAGELHNGENPRKEQRKTTIFVHQKAASANHMFPCPSLTVFIFVFIFFCLHVCLVAGQCRHLNVNILEGDC
jgi:hypothetical protein